MTWSAAFARQALSDLDGFAAALSDRPKCDALHALQMAGEKCAKVYVVKHLTGHPTFSHEAISPFLAALRSARSERDAVGLGFRSIATLRESARNVKPTALYVEACAPAIANGRVARGEPTSTSWSGLGVNVEYPWRNGLSIVTPADYPFDEPELRPIALAKYADFLRRIAASLIPVP